MTATAFPIAIADRCAGVIEFFSRGVSAPNAEMSAMFATVGGQLAQYLGNHAPAGDGIRRWLDAVEAPLLALDAEGRVLLANRNACALAGRPGERSCSGVAWVDAAVAEGERAAVRAALAGGERAEHAVDGERTVELAALTALGGGGRARHLGDRHRAR